MSTSTYDNLFNIIEQLVLHHSPSGAESEIDRLLLQNFEKLQVKAWIDRAGNAIAHLPGKDSTVRKAITAALNNLSNS